MNRRTIVFLILIVVASLIGLLAYIFWSEDVSWNESYKYDDENPYGCSVLFELLKVTHESEGVEVVNDSIHLVLNSRDTTTNNESYFYIGDNHYANAKDAEALNKFMRQGNSVFLFVNYNDGLVFNCFDSVYWNHDYPGAAFRPLFGSTQDTTVLVSLLQSSDTSARMSWDVNFEPESYSWTNLVMNDFDLYSVPYQRLGTFQARTKIFDVIDVNEDIEVPLSDSISDKGGLIPHDFLNYVRIPVGKGALYLHTTPIAFTNYHLLSDSVMNYCRQALRYMPEGKIYWDEENRKFDTALLQNGNIRNDKGPLEFVLSESNLRRAWYLMLLLALLYLFFGARRKQRIIPILEKKENTSIEYAQVISGMFLNQKDHRKLVLLKIDLFKLHLRERFGLRMPDSDQNILPFVHDLSTRIRVNEQELTAIFLHLSIVQSLSEVTLEDLLRVHQELEFLYEKTK